MRVFNGNFILLCSFCVFFGALAGCATVSVTPGTIERPNPVIAYNAIEAEPSRPVEIAVRDFDFASASVTENRSPIHRALDLFKSSSPNERQVAIGRKAAATLSKETTRRLSKTGLRVTRIPADNDIPVRGDVLLVTGRLIQVNEGNRFTRVALGLGLGESRLVTEVHVFRLMNDEKAEVLVFTTHANSGEMPGVAASMGVGEFLAGPINLIKAIHDVFSSGEKIYFSQVDHLASKTGDQVARYLSQYAAQQHWIPQDKARPVHHLAG